MLTELVDKKGKRGAWSSVDYVDAMTSLHRSIFHYSTRMLTFEVSTGDITYMHIGHGSVSDQQGMNRLFRKLNAPYYFMRRGGARIVNLQTGMEEA